MGKTLANSREGVTPRSKDFESEIRAQLTAAVDQAHASSYISSSKRGGGVDERLREKEDEYREWSFRNNLSTYEAASLAFRPPPQSSAADVSQGGQPSSDLYSLTRNLQPISPFQSCFRLTPDYNYSASQVQDFETYWKNKLHSQPEMSRAPATTREDNSEWRNGWPQPGGSGWSGAN
jgi:hypothetical protein